MEWTRRQITELAPNHLILERAKSLSKKESWEVVGGNGATLWGICKSSGQRTYQVAINFSNKAFRCDCQEQEHPCRHILSLLFYMLRYAGELSLEETPPGWVSEAFRRPATAKIAPAELEQRKIEQEKRFGKRLEEMKSGIEELELWLLDMIQHGLSEISNQESSYWELLAAKMQDAKLGGIARRIRRIPSLLGMENWHERLLEELSQLYLFVQSYKQFASLPEAMQEEVLSIAGVNKKRAEVLEMDGVKDQWLVLSVVHDSEDQLFSRKTYLLGNKSKRIALLLDYNYGRPSFDTNWQVGNAFSAELVFYPSAYPVRAVVKKHQPSAEPIDIIAAYQDIESFAQAYAQAIAANPWLFVFPCLLANVYVTKKANQLFLADEKGAGIPLQMEGNAAWSLLAVSAGQPITIFGEWDDHFFTPMALLKDGRVIALTANPVEFDENVDI